MINVEREYGDIVSITIGDEQLESDDGETWIVPRTLLKGLSVNDLPEDATFEVCKRVEAGVILLDPIPIKLRRTGDSQAEVLFEDGGTRKYWDGEIGFKAYMEMKKAIVEERQKELGDLKLESYEDDGAWIWLHYSSVITANDCGTVAELAEQVVGEIEGAAEIRLGRPVLSSKADDEQQFTLHLVLPILRMLGFTNVRYNHGRREYGKDVLFARRTEFGELEHWAAQVKYGDVSAGAAGEIDTILGQIDDAFKMPFYDLYTRQQQRIAKLAVIVSGRFTENAIEKIVEKVETHAARNNLVFVDGAKIETLTQRFR